MKGEKKGKRDISHMVISSRTKSLTDFTIKTSSRSRKKGGLSSRKLAHRAQGLTRSRGRDTLLPGAVRERGTPFGLDLSPAARESQGRRGEREQTRARARLILTLTLGRKEREGREREG